MLKVGDGFGNFPTEIPTVSPTFKVVTNITVTDRIEIKTEFTLPIGLIISSMRTTEHELIEDDVVESVAPKTALIYTPAKPGATVANI